MEKNISKERDFCFSFFQLCVYKTSAPSSCSTVREDPAWFHLLPLYEQESEHPSQLPCTTVVFWNKREERQPCASAKPCFFPLGKSSCNQHFPSHTTALSRRSFYNTQKMEVGEVTLWSLQEVNIIHSDNKQGRAHHQRPEHSSPLLTKRTWALPSLISTVTQPYIWWSQEASHQP